MSEPVSRATVTEQDRVFARRLCELLDVEPHPERIKALGKFLADYHEVAVSCAVVRVERLFDVRERKSKPAPKPVAKTNRAREKA